MRLTEIEVKAKVLDRLQIEGMIYPGAIIANEVRLRLGRIDLAILADAFIGIEIKSQYDSLRRLPAQITIYSRYFDRLILVVAENHTQNVVLLAPEYVDVWTITSNGDVAPTRRARGFPALNDSDFLKLLTAEELRRADHAEFANSRAFFLDAFQGRFGETSKLFWKSAKKKRISSKHLVKLSRFAGRRQKFAKAHKETQKFWKDWNESAAMLFPPHDRSAQSVQSSSVS